MTGIVPMRAVEAYLIERLSGATIAEAVQLTMRSDSTWSPRTQAELTLTAFEWPLPEWEQRQADWACIRLVTMYRPRILLEQITAEHDGDLASITTAFGGDLAKISAHYSLPWNALEPILPLSAWTALWGGNLAAVTVEHGGQLAPITERMRRPGGAWLAPPTETTVARLKVRHIADNGDGSYTYGLASDDVRMHEYRRTEVLPLVSSYTSLRELVEAMLSHLVDGTGAPSLEPGDDVAIPAGLTWAPGVTLWDTLAPTLEAVGWELFADLDARWHLRPRAAATAPHGLDPAVNLIEYLPGTDYATAGANAAVIEYPDTTSTLPEDRFDIWKTWPGASRVLYERRAGNKPAPGAARELVERSRARASTATARSTIAHQLRAGQRLPLELADFPRYATIRSLSHDLAAAETRYELTDIRTT